MGFKVYDARNTAFYDTFRNPEVLKYAIELSLLRIGTWYSAKLSGYWLMSIPRTRLLILSTTPTAQCPDPRARSMLVVVKCPILSHYSPKSVRILRDADPLHKNAMYSVKHSLSKLQ